MLTYLVVDLARSPELRRRFESEPLQVLAEYEISETTRQMLRMETLAPLQELLRSEVVLIHHQVLEQAHRNICIPWPGGTPVIKKVVPSKGPINQNIQFTITGSDFEDGATVTFVRPGTTVTATSVNVNSSGTVLTCQATFTQAGIYDVKVTNPDPMGGLAASPAAFEAVSP